MDGIQAPRYGEEEEPSQRLGIDRCQQKVENQPATEDPGAQGIGTSPRGEPDEGTKNQQGAEELDDPDGCPAQRGARVLTRFAQQKSAHWGGKLHQEQADPPEKVQRAASKASPHDPIEDIARQTIT